jgi:hypothetical protein
MTPPLAWRLKLSETASPLKVARLTGDTGRDLETKGLLDVSASLLWEAGLECDLDRFVCFVGEERATRFTRDGVSGVFASERIRWFEGVFGLDIVRELDSVPNEVNNVKSNTTCS